MHILVTGGAGYIGSLLVPALLNKSCQVTVIDNFMYEQTSLLDCCHDKRLTVIRGDARDRDLIAREIKKADYIFPLACLTGAPVCNKHPFEAESIVYGAVKLILKLRSKSQRVIFPSTNSGYVTGQKSIYCTEETPLRANSLYGKYKAAAEEDVLAGGNSITLRLASNFGVSPRMRLDLLLNDFVYRAVNDRFLILFESHFKRNFIHLRDVVRAFIHCMDNFDRMKNEPYNVGLTEANMSKKELCEEIKKQIPDFYFVEANVGKDPDKRNYIVSNEKIEKTGFKPKFSLQMGITELIKGYQIIRRNQFSNG
mgnify:CR=1 FL=1